MHWWRALPAAIDAFGGAGGLVGTVFAGPGRRRRPGEPQESRHLPHRAWRAQPALARRIMATGTVERIAALVADASWTGPGSGNWCKACTRWACACRPGWPSWAAAAGDGATSIRQRLCPAWSAICSRMRSRPSNASRPCCTSACAWTRHEPPTPGRPAVVGKAPARRWWLIYHLGEPEYRAHVRAAAAGGWVALDCETTGLNPRSDESSPSARCASWATAS